MTDNELQEILSGLLPPSSGRGGYSGQPSRSTMDSSLDDILGSLMGPGYGSTQPSFDFVGPVRPGEEYSPEFMGPIAPPSPRDALQRQVDATIAARETSQRYATLPKRVADVYNVYKNEDLAREALDLADQLKIEYPEYGEDIEDLLMKGLRPEDIRTQITQKRERKRRQSELATQYPDFARDVDKLFKEGFSPEEVTSRMEAMAGAKARIEQRKQEEVDRKSAEAYAKEIEAQQARTSEILSTAGIEAGQSASRVGELTRQIEVGRAAGQDISDLERERRLIQAYGIQGLPIVARISALRRRLATAPEPEMADIQFLINSLQRGLGGATTEQVVTAQPTPGEALTQQLYGEARGVVTGATLGAARPLFERAEEATGGVVPRQGIGETAAEAIGGLATGVVGAGALAPSVSGLYAGLGGVGAQAATRGTIGGIQSGAQTAIALAQGADISPADAAVNIGQGILSSALSVPIAAKVPGVKLNAAAQVAGDFVVDLAADVGYRDRLKDQSFVDWLLKEELPNLAVSIAGAGKDVLDARAAKTEIRRLFDQRMRSGAATPPPPTMAEPADPELVTRPTAGTETPVPARDFVLDSVTGRPVEGAGVGSTDELFKLKLKALGYTDAKASEIVADLRSKRFSDQDIEDSISQVEQAIRERAPAPARQPAPVEPAPSPSPEPAPKPEPLPPARPSGPVTEFTSADDLRARLQEKIAGATNRRKAIEEDARYYNVSTRGKTAKQLVDEIVVAATKPVEPEPVVRPPVAEEPSAPAPRPEEPAPEPGKKARGFSSYKREGLTPIIDYINDEGGLLQRSKLRNKQGGEYDAAPSVSELGGFGRAVYGGSIPADEMATMLYNAGLIDDASPDLMFSKIRSEINSYRQNRSRNAEMEQQDKLASKQSKAFQRDAVSKPKEKEPVNTSSLNVGDEVKIGGESFKVLEIDPDTNAVVLEDGEKYGVQIVEDGVTIYGKVEKKAPQAEGESPFGEGLRLESQTPEQVASERARSEQRAEIERRQAEPMRGKPLDTTADIFGEGETPLFNQRRAEAAAAQPQRIEDIDLGNLRAEIDAIASYKDRQKRLNELAEQFGVPTGGTPKEILGRIEEAYNAAKKRQVAEGGVGEYRGDGARVQEEGQDRIVTPEVQEGRPEAGGGDRPAPSGNVPPGPVGRGVQGQQAVTPTTGGAVPPTTPPPAAGGAAGAAGAPAPLPGGQKRFGFIGSTKQRKSVEIDESISPNVKAVDDALERQQRDLERLSMDKGRKSFDSIAEGLWDSQSLVKRKLIASELKDAEARLIMKKGWAARANDQYEEHISAIDKLITHGNEKSFSEYLEMRRLVEVADLKSAKGEDYDLPYGITPEQAKEWISTFEKQKSADGTLNTYKAAADEYYKAARQQLDDMRAEGLLTKEGYASLVQNHKNYSPQQMIDKLDPENSSGLAKPGAGAPIKALKGGSESGRVIDYRYLLARTIAAAQNRIFTNRANKELVSGVQKGGEKVAKEIGAIIDDGSFDKIPAGYERIKSFDDGIEKSIFVPKEFAKSWNESDPGLNKATAEFLRTWSGSRVVKAMATGYNPEFIFSNFPRDAAYAWFRTGEYSPILPIGAVQQVKDYVGTAKDAFRKSGIYKDYLKEGGGLDGLSAEGRLDKNPWDKVTPTTQTARDLARWASFLGEFSERWTRLAVYNRAIKNGKSKMEAAKIARDMLDFSQGGKLVKGVDTVVPYLNAMTQGTRGLANSFTENGLGKQSFKAAQVMAIAAGLGSVAREYFNEQWNAISDQEKASKWIIPLPGSYKDDEGKTRYRYLAIPKDQGQAVFAAMSDAMVGAMRGEKPDAKALLFALKQAVPDVTAGSPIGNAALAYFNNLDTFRMEEVYRGRPTTPSAEFSGNAALDESMRKLSEISGGAIEISPARLKRATEKIILPHNPFTIMTGLAANQLLPEELRAEANEFAIENQPFIRRFLRSTQPIEVPASVAEKAERLGLETGDKPGKQVRREVYQAERELGAKRNVQDKEIRKIMSGIKSGRTSYRDLLRYIDETPEEDRNRIRRRMNDIQEEYGLEFDFSGSDIGLPRLSELRGGLKTIK